MFMAARKKKVFTLSVLVGLVFPALVGADPGFYLGTGAGFALPYFSGNLEDFDAEAGLNLELIHLGYNFTDNLGVGLQWGAGAGNAESDVVWSQGYMTVSGRFTYDQSDVLSLYGELGLGDYVLIIAEEEPEDVIFSDPVIGSRIAVGLNYYFDKIYFGTELSYHFAEYDEGELETEYYGDWDVEDLGGGDMMAIQLKAGYHWKK